MGFFDSLLKSTVRRVVNNVVDNAVDKAFNNNNTTTYNNQQQPMPQAQPQQQQIRYGSPITLPEPDPNMAYESYTNTIYPCICENEDDFDENAVEIQFQKSINLFEKDSGAAEITLLFMVADSENEAYNDNLFETLPAIYIGNDILFDDPGLKNKIFNATFSKVMNHPCIHEKQEFDLQHPANSYATHYIIYNFFASDKDRAVNRSTSITLEYSPKCSQDKKETAMQALDLFVSTFKLNK